MTYSGPSRCPILISITVLPALSEQCRGADSHRTVTIEEYHFAQITVKEYRFAQVTVEANRFAQVMEEYRIAQVTVEEYRFAQITRTCKTVFSYRNTNLHHRRSVHVSPGPSRPHDR